MQSILETLENYKRIFATPDLRLKTVAEFTEYPAIDMVLTADGSVYVYATTWNIRSSRYYSKRICRN